MWFIACIMSDSPGVPIMVEPGKSMVGSGKYINNCRLHSYLEWNVRMWDLGHFMPWPVLWLILPIDYTNERPFKECTHYSLESKFLLIGSLESPHYLSPLLLPSYLILLDFAKILLIALIANIRFLPFTSRLPVNFLLHVSHNPQKTSLLKTFSIPTLNLHAYP